MDELYEEFGSIKQVLESPEFQNLSVEQRYLQLSKVTEIHLKTFKVSSFLFSIPSSNAHTTVSNIKTVHILNEYFHW